MKKLIIASVVLSLVGLIPYFWNSNDEVPFTGQGNLQTLDSTYRRWKTAYENRANLEVVRIELNYSKARSRTVTKANGQALLNLVSGQMQVEINGLEGDGYEVWLVNNQPEKPHKALKIGQTKATANTQLLTTRLDQKTLNGFTIDSIVITQAGATPENGGILFGAPGILERLYYTERYWPTANLATAGNVTDSVTQAPFEFLLPKVAQAARKPTSTSNQLTDLIARGQKIFTEETFAGNGRTCSTCHRPDNNHTLDPAYIAKLPKTDPLFVAETNPALAKLENPVLLRQFGLILANIDGFDKPGVMRSPQSLLGISRSLTFETSAMGGEFVEDSDYFNEHNPIAQQTHRVTQALGWSGDGSPEGGSLRDFAIGGIKQHLPKTLNRVENVDFRMPTEDELDALEAYMLSLGRSDDLNLASMTFKSPLVQKGKQLFDTKQNPVSGGAPLFGTTANCNGCHMNAGAISSTTGGNPTRDTGVERMRDQLHHLADADVPYDGGFGQVLQQDCGPDFDQPCYSDNSIDPRNIRPTNHPRLNRFNTPSLIEAADTGPFFHNNSVTTLEEAVAYYNTEAFNQSPGAFTSKGVNRQIKLDSSQVIAVALFLRSINVLDNIRSSNALDQKALALNGAKAEKTIALAVAETEDTIQVLTEAVINPYPEALEKLQQALEAENKARAKFIFPNQRSKLLTKAIILKNQAKALIVKEG